MKCENYIYDLIRGIFLKYELFFQQIGSVVFQDTKMALLRGKFFLLKISYVVHLKKNQELDADSRNENMS
jgi:hypothetical protein